ncbi:MAG: hypothetical protein CMH83_04625 [Nocardioides sp.]|nr:hypothetical protein [Nocardioides sp.]
MGNRFPTGGKRVTIGDVAALAGVSKGTVSKFLGDGDYYIAEETRARIAAAVAELDFQPNAIAQGLVRRRTQTVGVIVASIANPVYPEMIAGIQAVLEERGFTLIIGSSEGRPEREAGIVRSMRQRQVDGIVMASVTMRDGEVAALVGDGLDVVLASRNLARGDLVDAVVVDNVAGARAAVEHLAGHGHTRIAHVAGPQDVVPFTQRRQAYCDAVSDAGLDADPDLVTVAEASTLEAGADAVRRLLALPEPPTAVFVGSDGMAIGALEHCARAGVVVPRDLAVVGFDNIWVGRMPGISLTTVDSHARDVGTRAAHRLLSRIEARWEGRSSPPPRPAAAETTVLPAELVVRGTCGCASDVPLRALAPSS